MFSHFLNFFNFFFVLFCFKKQNFGQTVIFNLFGQNFQKYKINFKKVRKLSLETGRGVVFYFFFFYETLNQAWLDFFDQNKPFHAKTNFRLLIIVFIWTWATSAPPPKKERKKERKKRVNWVVTLFSAPTGVHLLFMAVGPDYYILLWVCRGSTTQWTFYFRSLGRHPFSPPGWSGANKSKVPRPSE